MEVGIEIEREEEREGDLEKKNEIMILIITIKGTLTHRRNK